MSNRGPVICPPPPVPSVNSSDDTQERATVWWARGGGAVGEEPNHTSTWKPGPLHINHSILSDFLPPMLIQMRIFLLLHLLAETLKLGCRKNATLIVYVYIFVRIHSMNSYNTFIHRHLPRCLSISSWLRVSAGKTSLVCRAKNWIEAYT